MWSVCYAPDRGLDCQWTAPASKPTRHSVSTELPLGCSLGFSGNSGYLNGLEFESIQIFVHLCIDFVICKFWKNIKILSPRAQLPISQVKEATVLPVSHGKWPGIDPKTTSINRGTRQNCMEPVESSDQETCRSFFHFRLDFR